MLESGLSPERVARMMQVECGAMPEIKRKSLAASLRRYRERVGGEFQFVPENQRFGRLDSEVILLSTSKIPSAYFGTRSGLFVRTDSSPNRPNLLVLDPVAAG